MQFYQGRKPKYIPYDLSEKVIDWKSMWFYVRNLSSSLPLRTPGPPVKRLNWNTKGSGGMRLTFFSGRLRGQKQIIKFAVFCDCALVDVQDPAAAAAG